MNTIKFCLMFNRVSLFSYRPTNGGKFCDGEHREYRLCNTKVSVKILDDGPDEKGSRDPI